MEIEMCKSFVWGVLLMNGGEVFVFDDKFIQFDFNVALIVWDNPLSVEKQVVCR